MTCDSVDSTETNELNYEVEQWNTNGRSYVWVQVPHALNSNSYIWAYWGNSNVAAAPAVYTTNGAVWPTNAFVGVWHMKQSNVLDSTANRNNGIAVGNIKDATSLIGEAQEVDGGYAEIADSPESGFCLRGGDVLRMDSFRHASER